MDPHPEVLGGLEEMSVSPREVVALAQTKPEVNLTRDDNMATMRFEDKSSGLGATVVLKHPKLWDCDVPACHVILYKLGLPSSILTTESNCADELSPIRERAVALFKRQRYYYKALNAVEEKELELALAREVMKRLERELDT